MQWVSATAKELIAGGALQNGTVGSTRYVSGRESGPLEAMEGRRVAERHCQGIKEERRTGLPRRPPKVYQAWPLESVPGSVATSKCTTRVGGHFKVYQLT